MRIFSRTSLTGPKFQISRQLQKSRWILILFSITLLLDLFKNQGVVDHQLSLRLNSYRFFLSYKFLLIFFIAIVGFLWIEIIQFFPLCFFFIVIRFYFSKSYFLLPFTIFYFSNCFHIIFFKTFVSFLYKNHQKCLKFFSRNRK